MTVQEPMTKLTKVKRVASDTFRRIMSSFPTGVTVISTRGPEGEPIGLTANAVSSVSLEPPQLLVCLGRDKFTTQAIQTHGGFAVSFLSREQRWIAERFASLDPDKFAGVPILKSPRGLPVIEDALAYAECTVHKLIEAGDHVIVIGDVAAGEADDGNPLMFFQREYGAWHRDQGE